MLINLVFSLIKIKEFEIWNHCQRWKLPESDNFWWYLEYIVSMVLQYLSSLQRVANNIVAFWNWWANIIQSHLFRIFHPKIQETNTQQLGNSLSNIIIGLFYLPTNPTMKSHNRTTQITLSTMRCWSWSGKRSFNPHPVQCLFIFKRSVLLEDKISFNWTTAHLVVQKGLILCRRVGLIHNLKWHKVV